MREYQGYATKNGKRFSWTVDKASSKKKAHDIMKEDYPDWRIYVVMSKAIKGKSKK